MTGLKLGKLPDRTPIKLTISVAPELNQRLLDYAAVYAESYGRLEPVLELIPAILSAFLDSDRVFARSRERLADKGSHPSV
jgi:hypothetical protein